eukprot:3176604-Pleurochrysis_carterae.AAC.1
MSLFVFEKLAARMCPASPWQRASASQQSLATAAAQPQVAASLEVAWVLLEARVRVCAPMPRSGSMESSASLSAVFVFVSPRVRIAK